MIVLRRVGAAEREVVARRGGGHRRDRRASPRAAASSTPQAPRHPAPCGSRLPEVRGAPRRRRFRGRDARRASASASTVSSTSSQRRVACSACRRRRSRRRLRASRAERSFSTASASSKRPCETSRSASVVSRAWSTSGALSPCAWSRNCSRSLKRPELVGAARRDDRRHALGLLARRARWRRSSRPRRSGPGRRRAARR